MSTRKLRGLRREDERARGAAARGEVARGAGCGLALCNEVSGSSRWMSDAVRRRGRHGGVGGKGGMAGSGLAQSLCESVYSPKIFFRLDFVVFRCPVRPFDGRSTCRASSYMWYVSRGD